MKITDQTAKYDIKPDFQILMDDWEVNPPFLGFGTQCHTYAVNEYITDFHNNVRLHAKRRIWRFFRLWTGDKDAIKRTIRYLFHNDVDENPVIPDYWLLFTYRDEIGPLLTREERERDLINHDDDNQIPRGWFTTLFDDVKWYKHAHEFIRIQMHVYDYNIEHQQIKSFVVVPQRKSKGCHIRIDSKALATIGLSFEVDDVVKVMLRKVRGGKLTVGQMKKVFGRYFQLNEMNLGASELEYTLTTDGVSCHYQKARYVPNVETGDETSEHTYEDMNEIDAHDRRAYEWIDEFDQSRPAKIRSHPTRAMDIKYASNQYEYIIGMDPGYKLPVAIVRKSTLDDSEENHTMTYEEFHKRCGAGERKSRLHNINRRLKRTLKTMRELLPKMTSCRSRQFENYIKYQMIVFNASCRVYRRRFIVKKQFVS